MRAATRSALPIVALTLITVALLAVAPGSLRIAFPPLAFIAAAVTFRQSRTVYINLCLWLWFLSPLLRRLVDFRTEFVATSPLLLAPFAACAVSGVVLIRTPRALSERGAIPFTCALFGIFFGTVYGLTRYPPADVARGLVNWLPPVLFGFFLYAERTRFQQYREAITRTLLRATLLLGAYGILQFFLLPSWDEAWMRGLQNGAFGQPVAMQLRVFSTMNAPATFATYLVAGLLLAFAAIIQRGQHRKLALAAAPIGLLALALTTTRALWLALLFGVLYLAATLPARLRVRIIATVLIALVLAGLATTLPGIHDVVTARIKTFTSGTSDVSASARINGHLDALIKLATEPLGEGMGSTDADHATDGSDDRLGPHDSTLLDFLYALGGPGTLVYGVGILLGAVQIFILRKQKGDPMAAAFKAILFGLFAQSLLTSILIGVPGFLVWTCLAVALSAPPRS